MPPTTYGPTSNPNKFSAGGGITSTPGTATNVDTRPDAFPYGTPNPTTGNTQSANTTRAVTPDKQPTLDGDEKAKDELGDYVRGKFSDVSLTRNKIDELLLQCLRQRQGEYDPTELAMMGSTSIKTFYGITGTKCRAGEAWLNDILTASGERAWNLKPTPIPEVPDYVKQLIVQQMKEELQRYGPQPESVLRDRIRELGALAYNKLVDAATEGTDRMERKIDDQLTQADWQSMIQAFVCDLMTYPFAVLKAPVMKRTRQIVWEGATPKVQDVTQPFVERVSPFDFYWAEWATTPQEGYIIEIMHMPRTAIHDCIGMANFDDDAIRDVLQDYPDGHMEQVPTKTMRETLERGVTSIENGDIIDVLDFWGAIKGDVLADWGVSVDDEDASYECNAWVVGNRCIRALLNPDPLKHRNYYATSYEKIPGSFMGRSVPMLMRPNQEVINSAYRALRRNMGLASGPFAECDQSRLGGQQAPEEILPAMVKVVEPDLSGTGKPAYYFHKIDSHVGELEALIDAEIRKCDDATGIPAYSYGNAAVAGAGKTVGGLAMLMGNASKGIKKVITNIEQDILDPLITAFYNYNMLYDPDQTMKIDAQVVAQGPTSVLAREATVQKRLQALQIIGPFIPTGIIEKDGIATLLRETLRPLELPVDKIIPDPEIAKKMQVPGQGPPGQDQGQSGPPGPPQQGAPQGGPPGAPPGPPQGPPQAGPMGGNVVPLNGPAGPQQPPQGVPAQPGMGGPSMVQPDGRSGPAGAVVAAQRTGRM
jgi:hypothetical protein